MKNDKTPNKNLKFVSDKHLYDEMIRYFTKEFPGKEDFLNRKFVWDSAFSTAVGSSSVLAIGADMYLESQNVGYRIATLKDLEKNPKLGGGIYVDTGLVLRSLEDPNFGKAKYLREQIRKANPQMDLPIYIQSRGLKLTKGLNFLLTDESVYKTANCLNCENYMSYSQTDNLGLPENMGVDDDDRTLNVPKFRSGLIGVYLSCDRILITNEERLDSSAHSGRIVLVKN
jgi:hypothetical protein